MNDPNKDAEKWDWTPRPKGEPVSSKWDSSPLPIDEPPTEEEVTTIEVTEGDVQEAVVEVDPEKLRVAAIRYHKNNRKVSLDSAYEIMRNDPVLLEKWAAR